MINHRRFFSQLLLLTLLTGLVVFFLLIFEPFSPHKILSYASLLFFAALTAGIYFPAAKAAQSNDRNAFTRLVMVFTFVKMFLTAGLVIAYQRLAQPENNYFLVPFFLTYIVFTVFETIFMSKLAKVKPK
jgi:hypothetical protein